jgi:hypothetical protein
MIHVDVLDGVEDQIVGHSNEGFPESTGPEHLRWMIEELRSGRVTGEKAHRWLGFVQGVLAAREQLVVETERNRTRPYFT